MTPGAGPGAAVGPGAAAPGPEVPLGPGTVDAVLFDVDDTLVDTAGAFAGAIAAVAREYLPHLPEPRHAEVLALWREDPDGHYRAYTGGAVDYETQRMRRANQLHAVFGGPPLDEAGYRAWREVFVAAFAAGWRAHDDAAPLLAGLAGAGVAVGAVSNAGTALQEAKLRRSGLERVPLLVGVDTFGVGKPDPRVFLEGCRLLGTEPARTVYVGDEADIDARAARAAGLVGVWLDRPAARRGGVHASPAAVRGEGIAVVHSLSELGALLGV